MSVYSPDGILLSEYVVPSIVTLKFSERIISSVIPALLRPLSPRFIFVLTTSPFLTMIVSPLQLFAILAPITAE